MPVLQYGNIKVHFKAELDGGGSGFGSDYARFVASEIGKVGRVFEWCAGPGFIGFSLLAAGLCDTLALADINPEAVALMKETIRRNGLEDRVSVYCSDCLDDIPPHERWDLVVGNPPHSANRQEVPQWGTPLIYQDLYWRLHRRFFQTIGRHMNRDGRIVLQESYFCSTADSFADVTRDNGWCVYAVSPLPSPHQSIYYLCVCRAEAKQARGASTGSGRHYFDYTDPAQRNAERHVREHAGFAHLPRLGTPAQILDYRAEVLRAMPAIRSVLGLGRVRLSLHGPGGGHWLIRCTAGEALFQPCLPEQPCDAVIELSAQHFVDLYDRRIKILRAYFDESLRVRGRFDLAQVVLQGLLAPSASSITD